MNLEESDLREVCYHVAGHTAVANRYGLDATFMVERVGDPTTLERAWIGQTRFPAYRATLYQKAVIAWSGALAEALRNEPLDEWPDDIEEVGGFLLEEYHDGEPSLSPTDRQHIKEGKLFKRAFNRACFLVVACRAEIAALAEQVIARHSRRGRFAAASGSR
jgi:hypothetical protein